MTDIQYAREKNAVIIRGLSDFEPKKIFECGQCFRWNPDADGVFTGIAGGRVTKVWKQEESVFISCGSGDFESFWYDYFDISKDYSALRESVCVDEFMKAAAQFGKGIRILNQDKWEALCSFIISQCNNIPRIKRIIEALCSLYGDEIEYEGDIYYSFPSASRIALLEPSDLVPIRCGYRAAYIIDAARKVANSDIDLDALSGGSYHSALETLKTISGVGDKVANCVILFGLRIPDAFPVDVWMKKILAKHYASGFDPKIFGRAAGLAQQYMFYFAREGTIFS